MVSKAMLSLSFERDVPTSKVGGSHEFSSAEGASFLGESGACPSRKFWNLDAWKCYFHCFPDSIQALRTIKIKTILTIFYAYNNHSFPPNLSHWFLEKSEMINLQMLIPKKYIQCFKFMFSLSKKTCFSFKKSVLSKVCLGYRKAWDLVLWKCSRRFTTLRSAFSAITFYTSTERLLHLRVNASKNQRNRGHSSEFNFAHTLSIGRPKSHTYDKDS